MKRPDDDMLMAFADNALRSEEMAAIERYLTTDAEARALVATFRETRDALRSAIPLEAFERPDDPLARALLAGELGSHKATDARRIDVEAVPDGTPAKPGSADVVQFSRRAPQRLSNEAVRLSIGQQWSLPLAASIALLIGGAVGYGLRGPANPVEISDTSQPRTELTIGALMSGSPIARFLENSSTGETLALVAPAIPAREDVGQPDELVLAGTFITKDGRPCREFERIQGGSDGLPLSAGVACRSSTGTWTIEGAIHLAAATTDQAGKIEPASGTGDGVPEAAALDALITMLGASTVLTPDQERALLDRGWRTER